MSSTAMPVHPLTGARALGWRKARPGEDPEVLYPIWPVLGAATDDQDDDADDEDTSDDGQDDDTGDSADEDDADPEGADQLGDAGKKALSRMKEKLKAERARRRAVEQRLNTDRGDDGGKDAEAIRRQAEQAATAKANARILRSEVRAAAAGKLSDPGDALRFLDLDQFEIGEDGEIDTEEIDDAIDDLLQNRPYLAAATAKRFQGTGDGGAARKAGRPKQLTEQDLKSMTPEQIVKAKREGRLNDYLGIK